MFLIYHISFIITLLFASIYKTCGNQCNIGYSSKKLFNINLNSIVAVCSFLPLFVISGIRYGVGSDYFDYMDSFLAIIYDNVGIWTVGANDIGYVYLCKCIGLFTDEPIWFYIVTSFLSIGILFKAIYEQSNKPWLSVFIYLSVTYYYFGFTLIRNMLAISIFVYSIKFIQENNLKKYIVGCLLAASVHNSLIITLPIYWIANCKFETKVIKNIFFLLFALVLIRPLVGEAIMFIANNTRYGLYYFKDYYDGKTDFVWMIVHITVLIFVYYLWRMNKYNEKHNLGILMQVLAVATTIYSAYIPLAFRIMFVFAVPQIIIIPNILEDIKCKKLKYTLTSVTCLFYLSLYLVIAYYKQWNTVVPYSTFFSN